MNLELLQKFQMHLLEVPLSGLRTHHARWLLASLAAGRTGRLAGFGRCHGGRSCGAGENLLLSLRSEINFSSFKRS